jgi:phosphate transport system substrate-binding protein
MRTSGIVGRASMIFISLVSFAFTGAAHAEAIKLSVSRSAQEGLFEHIKAPFEKETGIQITYVQAKNAEVSSYFKDVIDGKADAAVASQAYDTWVGVMKDEKAVVPADITNRVISRDILQLVTNKDAKISKLTLEQVEAVFTGKAKSWKDVGGADIPVTLIMYKSKPGKGPSFRKLAMHDQSFGKSVKEVAGEEDDIVKATAATPGSVAFITRQLDMKDVMVIETPPLGRPVTMITKGPPTPAVQKLIQFIRTNGSKFGIP